MDCLGSKRASVGSKTGGAVTIRAPRCVITLEEIKFGGSHNVLHANDVLSDLPPEIPDPFRIDWGHSGEPHSQPAWRRADGRNVPVSYTRGTTMSPLLVLTVELRRGDPPQGRLVGTPVGREEPAFTFVSSFVTLRRGNISLQVDADGPLPEWPQRMDRRISWRFDTRNGAVDIEESGPHTVFVTFDTPVNTGRYEEQGATRARMDESMRRVAETGARPGPLALIDRLVKNCGGMVLQINQLSDEKRREIEENDSLKRYMREVGWPHFMHKGPERGMLDTERLRRQGGAWPLASLRRYGGECQAIIRFVRGVLHQLGFSDGKISGKYVSADFRNPSHAIISRASSDACCRGPEQECEYALLSRRIPGVGVYDCEEIAPNTYEAYLQYRYEKDGNRYQAWYGGGIGLVGHWKEERHTNEHGEEVVDIPQEAKNQLLRVFYGIAECRYEEQGGSTPKIRVLRYHSYK